MLEPLLGRRLLGLAPVLLGQRTFELVDPRAGGCELGLGGAPRTQLGVDALGQLALPAFQRGHPALQLRALALERRLDGGDGVARLGDRALGRLGRLDLRRLDVPAQDHKLALHGPRPAHGVGEVRPRRRHIPLRPRDGVGALLQLAAAGVQLGGRPLGLIRPATHGRQPRLQPGALLGRRREAQLELAQLALELRGGLLVLARAREVGLLGELGPARAALGEHGRIDHRALLLAPVSLLAQRGGRRQADGQWPEVELDGLVEERRERVGHRERGAKRLGLGRGAGGRAGRLGQGVDAVPAVGLAQHEHRRGQALGRRALPCPGHAQEHRAQVGRQHVDRVDAQPRGLGGARARFLHGGSG